MHVHTYTHTDTQKHAYKHKHAQKRAHTHLCIDHLVIPQQLVARWPYFQIDFSKNAHAFFLGGDITCKQTFLLGQNLVTK